MTTLLENIAALKVAETQSKEIGILVHADGKEILRQDTPAKEGRVVTYFDRHHSVIAVATIATAVLWNSVFDQGTRSEIEVLKVTLYIGDELSTCTMSWYDTMQYQAILDIAERMLDLDIELDAVTACVESVCCATDIDPSFLNAAIQAVSGVALNES